LLQRLQSRATSLHLVGKGWARDLLAGHGWPVQVLAARTRERVASCAACASRPARRPGLRARINALALPYSLSSALEMRLAGLRAIGHQHEGRGWLLQRAVPRSHASTRWPSTGNWGRAAGARRAAARPHPAALAPQHERRPLALRQQLGLRPGYVVVCPFAGGSFEKLDKCWPDFPVGWPRPSPHWGETC
jgi:heptosyltransferase-2